MSGEVEEEARQGEGNEGGKRGAREVFLCLFFAFLLHHAPVIRSSCR